MQAQTSWSQIPHALSQHTEGLPMTAFLLLLSHPQQPSGQILLHLKRKERKVPVLIWISFSYVCITFRKGHKRSSLRAVLSIKCYSINHSMEVANWRLAITWKEYWLNTFFFFLFQFLGIIYIHQPPPPTSPISKHKTNKRKPTELQL